MRSTFQSVGVIALLVWCGCPSPQPPGPEGETSFTTSEDISGTNPEAAQFAVFGAAELSGQGKLFVVVSDNPDPCAQIGSDFLQFGFDVVDGKVAGTFLFISVSSFEGFPGLGELFVSDGANDAVGITFVVSDGTAVIGSGEMPIEDGTMKLTEFSIDQILSAEFSGGLDETLDSVALDVELSGQVVGATSCPAVVDFIVNF